MIEEIDIPSDVKVIQPDAFSSCEYLQKVTFAEDSECIVGEGAFYACYSLAEITGPIETVTSAVAACENKMIGFEEIHNNYNFDEEESTFSKDLTLHIIGTENLTQKENDWESIFSEGDVDIEEIFAKYFDERFNELSTAISSLVTISQNDEELTYTGIGVTLDLSKTPLTYIPLAAINAVNIQKIQLPDTLQAILPESFISMSITELEIPASLSYLASPSILSTMQPLSINFKEPSSIKIINKIGSEDAALNKIYIPSSVEKIEDRAFAFTELKSITFAQNSQLESIGKKAFYGAHLSQIVLPESVKSIGENAFQNCKRLETITCSPEQAAQVILACEESCGIDSPNGYVTIKVVGKAYSEQGKNNGAKFISDVKEALFEAAENEESANIALDLSEVTGITKFDDCAFYQEGEGGEEEKVARTLVHISLPKTLTSIDGMSFYGSGLKSIELPQSLTYIGNNSFSKSSLESIVIPENVESISAFAFYSTKLKSVFIPSGVKIGAYAFMNCNSLKTIQFTGTCQEWASVFRENDWHLNVPASKVICSDGETDIDSFIDGIYLGTKAPGAKLSAGDIVFSDGSALPFSALSTSFSFTQEHQQNALAFIFYAGGEDDILGKKTLGVGLKTSLDDPNEANHKLAWAVETAEGYDKELPSLLWSFGYEEDSVPADTTYDTLPISGLGTLYYWGEGNGKNCYTSLCQSIGDEGTAGAYPAFEWVQNYGKNLMMPEAYADGWYLPATEELYALFLAWDKNLDYVLNIVGSNELGEEGNNEIWSSNVISSEFIYDNTATYAHYMYFQKGDFPIIGSVKTTEKTVVAIREF